MVKLPPLTPPASCWPIVPVTEYTPPVLVPPPPSIVHQSMLSCAERNVGVENSAASTMVLKVLAFIGVASASSTSNRKTGSQAPRAVEAPTISACIQVPERD